MIQRNSKKKGEKFEKKMQKNPGSGAFWQAPLDLRSDTHCIECKYTDKKGYRISLELVEKIWNQSLRVGKEPGLIIGISKNENEMFLLNCTVSLQRK